MFGWGRGAGWLNNIALSKFLLLVLLYGYSRILGPCAAEILDVVHTHTQGLASQIRPTQSKQLFLKIISLAVKFHLETFACSYINGVSLMVFYFIIFKTRKQLFTGQCTSVGRSVTNEFQSYFRIMLQCIESNILSKTYRIKCIE